MPVLAKSDRYTRFVLASAQAGPFEIVFPLFADSDLEVRVNDFVRTDFTVQSSYLDGQDDNATITFSFALESGDVIEIYGYRPSDKERQVVESDDDNIEATQIQISRLSAEVQEVQRDVDRSFKAQHQPGKRLDHIEPDHHGLYSVVPGLNLEGDAVAIPIVYDPINSNQLTASVRIYFDQAPQNGHDIYFGNPHQLTIYAANIRATNYLTSAHATQTYTLYDGPTEIAEITFESGGGSVTMTEPFWVTQSDYFRLIGPAVTDPNHEKFEILIKGIIAS